VKTRRRTANDPDWPAIKADSEGLRGPVDPECESLERQPISSVSFEAFARRLPANILFIDPSGARDSSAPEVPFDRGPPHSSFSLFRTSLVHADDWRGGAWEVLERRHFVHYRREEGVFGLSRGEHRPQGLDEEEILLEDGVPQLLQGYVPVPVDVDCLHQQVYHVLKVDGTSASYRIFASAQL
jgi:hypothetical protein